MHAQSDVKNFLMNYLLDELVFLRHYCFYGLFLLINLRKPLCTCSVGLQIESVFLTMRSVGIYIDKVAKLWNDLIYGIYYQFHRWLKSEGLPKIIDQLLKVLFHAEFSAFVVVIPSMNFSNIVYRLSCFFSLV